jgi:KDO2-lipid IV(A) lauroyltransferase
MDLQKITNSRIGVSIGLALGRAIPPRMGYRLSGWVASRMATRKSSHMVQAVRSNQWVVRGGDLSPQDLDSAVEEVFTHAGRCLIDLYHNIQNPEGIKSLVIHDQHSQEIVQLSQDPNFGAIIVAPHISNFDLVLLAMAYRGLHGQVLTYGQPTGGYEIQNNIRAQTGLDITPVNPDVHDQAIENLRSGGFVITAVDRPIRHKSHFLEFFERKSPLPAGHIRMALQAGVPIIVASVSMDEDGLYHIQFSDPIPMQSYDEMETAIRINGEAVLKIFEERIRKHPGQWLMYYHAWPEVIAA